MTLAAMEADSEPSVLVIVPPLTYSPTAARKLLSYSAHGHKEIAELSGQVVFGTDEDAAAFLQTPGNGKAPDRGSRLLVIDSKTSVILADTNLTGFTPCPFKAITVEKMAVRSKDSTVYVSALGNDGFGVVEANWKTGVTHRLPLPVPDMARKWEITSVFAIPSGIGVARGPYLTLFDTTTRTPGPVLTLPIGAGGRPTHKSGFFPVPGYGLMQLSDGAFTRLTDRDFLTPYPNPLEFPSSEIDRNGKIVARTIDGRPYLIWGEYKAKATAQGSLTSEIVFFDLESQKEMLRKPLGTDVLTAFVSDPTGSRIYFIDPKTGDVLCFRRKSEEVTSFAKTGIVSFTNFGSALVEAN